ncbi:S8 family serine peptidase [Streptomyces sp. NPDC008343]|uniref:S8 family serine peptidase n=1 Tax=Streptomyces sp. NPDC008343 TaxID=3364828 RepID=UPI0036E57C2A
MFTRILHTFLLTGALAIVPVTSPVSAEAATTAAPDRAGAVTKSDVVTLVTGDVVRLDTLANGTQQASVVTTAPGSTNAGTHTYLHDGDVYVEPASALPLLAADKLDQRLFNVSSLVRQGYGDDDRSTLPLIVTYRSGTSVTSKAAPAGVKLRATFAGVGALSVSQPKRAQASFLADVLKRSDVEKVWLDARTHAVKPDLTRKTAKRPAARTKVPNDGTGSTIAVLDTGIDASHPDFAGRIDEMRDFTGADDPTDRLGWGTHSASVAAGSGAASGGQYAGVAPGAHLAVGKVYADNGLGYESWAIAGMEWAAASGADVIDVNVTGAVTRGNDPLTQAVDTLSKESDALFVVPTGQNGHEEPGTSDVNAPGAAAAALTVGGVDARTGFWWDQSRHGVMADRGAVKPEVIAPSVGVIGAVPGGGYASAYSTIAAGAHAAGAAAVLRAAHPDWSPTLLKATLASTATPVEESGTFTVGGGAVDLSRATAQSVTVDQGVMGFGHMTRPYRADHLRQQRKLTYQNHGKNALTLNLSTNLAGTTVQPSTVNLAPGASAEVTVTLDATTLDAGEYSGRVTATGPTGELATAVGFVKQDDTVDVTIRMLDRDGRPGSGRARVTSYHEDDGTYYPEDLLFTPDQQEWTIRLPEGDYNVFGMVGTPDASGDQFTDMSIVGLPKLAVHAPNFTVTLDARTARPMTLSTPKPSATHNLAIRWDRGDPGDPAAIFEEWQSDMTAGTPLRVSMSPTEKVTDAGFAVTSMWDAGVPLLQARSSHGRLEAWYAGGPLIQGRDRYRLVDADAQPKQVDGAVALVQQRSDIPLDSLVRNLAEAGAVAVAVYPAETGDLVPVLHGPRVVTMSMPRSEGLELRSATRRPGAWIELAETPRSPYAYDVSFVENRQIGRDLGYRVRPSDVATVATRIYSSGTGEGESGWIISQHKNRSCDCTSAPVADRVPTLGYTRTQYVTADRDVQAATAWQYKVGRALIRPRGFPTYRRGDHETLEFLKAPYSPGVSGGHQPNSQSGTTRHGDVIAFDYAAFTDAAGNWSRAVPDASVSTTLYAGDTELYSTPLTYGDVPVPASSNRYRLVSDVTNAGSVVGLMSSARTEWTFRSANAGEDPKVLPLLDIDYTDIADARTGRSALDYTNSARRGDRVSLDLSVTHQPGSSAGPVRAVSVQVSYDDGATWQKASVDKHHDGRYTATYSHPHKGEFVSLKVHTADADGNTTDQTLMHAYRLH